MLYSFSIEVSFILGISFLFYRSSNLVLSKSIWSSKWNLLLSVELNHSHHPLGIVLCLKFLTIFSVTILSIKKVLILFHLYQHLSKLQTIVYLYILFFLDFNILFWTPTTSVFYTSYDERGHNQLLSHKYLRLKIYKWHLTPLKLVTKLVF